MRLLPDSELMDFIADGSRAAFAALCRRKLPMAMSLAYGASGDAAQTLAITRWVMLDIWEGAPLWTWQHHLLDAWIEAMIQMGANGSLGPLEPPAQGTDLLSDILAETLARPQARPPGPLRRLMAVMGLGSGLGKNFHGLRTDALFPRV
jgi:hypothetical protein